MNGEFFEEKRWVDRLVYPHYKSKDVYRLTPEVDSLKLVRKGLFKYRREFTITANTFFEGNYISLTKWIMA